MSLAIAVSHAQAFGNVPRALDVDGRYFPCGDSAATTAPLRAGTVTASNRRQGTREHPWRGIDLDVYEQHMGDPRVGQLQRLHDITGEQLAAYPSRAIGVLGIAGGNGLDLIDPETTDAVYGYDINPDYLAACHLLLRVDSNCVREPKDPHAAGPIYPLKLLNLVASEKLKLRLDDSPHG